MAPPLRLALLVIAAFACLTVLLQPCQAFKDTKWSSEQRGNGRKEIEIHRIQSPGMGDSIYFGIDDPGINIDDPELLYYHHGAESPHYDSNQGVYYLATWKDEKPVIGMIVVLPHNWELDDNGDIVDLHDPRGLYLNYVVTSKRYRRQGVATALFNAIEQDANELMEMMEKQTTICTMDLESALCGANRRSPGRSIEIRLFSNRSFEALAFYRSLGFQTEPWQEKSDKPPSCFGKMRERIIWSWRYWTHSLLLVKFVHPSS